MIILNILIESTLSVEKSNLERKKFLNFPKEKKKIPIPIRVPLYIYMLGTMLYTHEKNLTHGTPLSVYIYIYIRMHTTYSCQLVLSVYTVASFVTEKS